MTEIETTLSQDKAPMTIKKTENEMKIEIIENSVAQVWEIPVENWGRKRQGSKYSRPRQMSIVFLTMLTKMDYIEITQLYKLNRTSFYNNIRKVQNDYNIIPSYRKLFDSTKDTILFILSKNHIFNSFKPLCKLLKERQSWK